MEVPPEKSGLVRLPDRWWDDLVRVLDDRGVPVPDGIYGHRETPLWQEFRLTFEDRIEEPEARKAAEAALEASTLSEEEEAHARLLGGTGWGGERPPIKDPKEKTEDSGRRVIQYPDLFVLFTRSGLPWSPLDHLLSAHLLVGGLPEVPVMQGGFVGSPPDVERAMRIRTALPGEPGLAFLEDDPDEVFEHIGKLVKSIQEVWGPHISMRADREQFLEAENWTTALLERVSALRAVLRREDVQLGALQDRLFNRLVTNITQTGYTDSPSLVHFALGPDTVHFETDSMDDLVVVEVEGFENAFLGDPLTEWGALLRFGPEAMAAMLRGAGDPELLLEHQGAQRLAIGFDLHFASTLAAESVRWRSLEPPALAEQVEIACRQLRFHLGQDVYDLMEGEVADAPPHLPLGVAAAVHRLAWSIGSTPRVGLRETEMLAGVMAWLELHERDASAEALTAAHHQLDRLGGRQPQAIGDGADLSHGLEVARSRPLPSALSAHLGAQTVERVLGALGPVTPSATLDGAHSWLGAVGAFSTGRQHMGMRYRMGVLAAWCAPNEGQLRQIAGDLDYLLEILPPADPLEESGPLEAVLARSESDPGAPIALLGLRRLVDLALLTVPLEVALAHALRPDREALIDEAEDSDPST